MATISVTIELNGTPLENDVQKRALQTFATLPTDDRGRISELIQNPKALSGLKKNWLLLKTMFR
jgi:hypothetical protein